MSNEAPDQSAGSSDAFVGTAGRDAPFTPVPVLVRSGFDGRWCTGFELIATTTDDGGTVRGRVRRTSDGTELPHWFSMDDVVDDDTPRWRA